MSRPAPRTNRSNATPKIGQSVTFTASFKNGTQGLSKPITICHYFNGVRSNDTTATTDANGQLTYTTS